MINLTLDVLAERTHRETKANFMVFRPSRTVENKDYTLIYAGDDRLVADSIIQYWEGSMNLILVEINDEVLKSWEQSQKIGQIVDALKTHNFEILDAELKIKFETFSPKFKLHLYVLASAFKQDLVSEFAKYDPELLWPTI